MTTLKEICAQRYAALPETNAKRATKRAYDVIAPCADVLGRTPEGFPDATVPWAHWLLDRADNGQVKPATAKAALVAAMDAGSSGRGELIPISPNAERNSGGEQASDNIGADSRSALVGISRNTEQNEVATILRRLAEATERMIGVLENTERERQALPAAPVQAPEDRALTRDEAARLLACSPRSVGRYVDPLPGRRGVYRESDVRRYVATGQPQKTTEPGTKAAES